MNPTEIADLVRQTRALIERRYVFADVAERLVTILDDGLAAGRYDADDPAAVVAAVNHDLQSVNGDKHLRLLHSAEEIPAEKPTEEVMLAQFRQIGERTAHGFATAARWAGNVGYLNLHPYLLPPSFAGPTAVASMNLVATSTALIVDLRQCIGGDPTMVQLMCTYLFDDEPVHLDDHYVRETDRIQQYWTLPYVPGPRLGATKPVFVLTSATTFSGGEAFAYFLQQHGRATVIGETTRGGAHPCERIRVHPHLQLSVPVARSIHPVSKTNWEGVGVTPDVAVPADDAHTEAHRRALEHVLSLDTAAALHDEARQALATPR